MTAGELFDLGYAEGLKRPLGQAAADRAAVILAPHWPRAEAQAA